MEKSFWVELYDLKEKQNNIRRGLFSRHNNMKKELCALKEEVELLKSMIRSPIEILEYPDLREVNG